MHVNYDPVATEVPPESKPEDYGEDISFADGPRLHPDPQGGSMFAARLDRMDSNGSEDLEEAALMSLTSMTAYKYLVRMVVSSFQL